MMIKQIIFIIALFTIFSQGRCQCPLGFMHHDFSCYHVGTTRLQWPKALEYCRNLGGSHLTTIETAEENSFLINYLKTNHRSPPKYWLGGNDLAQMGTWIWENDNTRIMDGFHDWQNGSPNNGGDDQNEHCLEIQEDHGWKWNDNECEEDFYAVCEFETQYPDENMGIIIG